MKYDEEFEEMDDLITRWQSKAKAAQSKCKRLEARVMELETMLRRVEWDEYEDGLEYCPVCYGTKPKHLLGCDLAKLLAVNSNENS